MFEFNCDLSLNFEIVVVVCICVSSRYFKPPLKNRKIRSGGNSILKVTLEMLIAIGQSMNDDLIQMKSNDTNYSMKVNVTAKFAAFISRNLNPVRNHSKILSADGPRRVDGTNS